VKWACAVIAALCFPALAFAQVVPQAAPAIETWQPPTLSSERYDEDWSKLADPEIRAEHWTGAFKYIPLQDDAYLITGAELRARYESNTGEVSGPADLHYLWLRATPYADLHVGSVRAFVQPIAAYSVDENGGPGPVDQTGIDFLQAFVDVDVHLGDTATLTFRGGREQMSLGTERLIGTRYRPNVPLAYDGGRLILHAGSWRVTAFWVRPVQSRLGNVNDRSSPTVSLWGMYANGRLTRQYSVDLYYLGYQNDLAVYARGKGREDRHTVGARFFGAVDGWAWNSEIIGQFGQFAGLPILAWSTSFEGSRTWSEVPLAPTVTLRANLISGDGGASARHMGDFNALFPTGKYFGELSPVGPRNIENVHLIGIVHPTSRLTGSLALVAYWRMRKADGLYDIPGNLIGVPGPEGGAFIGKEAETIVTWRATQELTFSATGSVMQPGEALRALGHTRDIGLFGVEANFRY